MYIYIYVEDWILLLSSMQIKRLKYYNPLHPTRIRLDQVLLSEDFFHNEMKPILCQWMCPGALKLVEPSKELLWSNSHLGDKFWKVFVGRTFDFDLFWSNSQLPKKIAGDCETTVLRGALVVAWTRRKIDEFTSRVRRDAPGTQVFGWPLSMWVHLSAWIYPSSNRPWK